MSVQPDLFGVLDAAEESRATRKLERETWLNLLAVPDGWQCPACLAVERSAWVLELNHHVGGDWFWPCRILDGLLPTCTASYRPLDDSAEGRRCRDALQRWIKAMAGGA